MTNFHSAVKRFKNHLLNDAGNVTMITAIAALPIFVTLSAGIEYARMNRDATEFKSAVDSAVLSLAASDQSTYANLTTQQIATRKAALETTAKNYLLANYGPAAGNASAVTATVTITGTTVSLTATRKVGTSTFGFLNKTSGTQSVTVDAMKVPRPIELSIVMDTTGSMGTTYMTQAKTAASNLLSSVYGDPFTVNASGVRTYTKTYYESKNVRVALVPFSAAVRLDTSANDYDSTWIDTTGQASVSKLNFSDSTWNNYMAYAKVGRTWNGCLEARMAGDPALNEDYNVNDVAPNAVADPDSLFTPYFAPDGPSYTGSYYTTNASNVKTYAVNDIPSSPNKGSTTFNSASSYDMYDDYIPENKQTAPTAITSGETKGFDNAKTSQASWPIYANLMSRQKNVAKYTTTAGVPTGVSAGPESNCPVSKIVPMTYDRTKIETGITAMTASGSTVIPEGLAWGWRAISPGAPFTKVEKSTNNAAATIAPYNDAKWRKVVVLMTDGENSVLHAGTGVAPNALNATWYNAYGFGMAKTFNRFGIPLATVNNNNNYLAVGTAANAALDAAETKLCDRMKAQGIEIFTVAFRVADGPSKDNLKACATDTAHFKDAADGVALAKAFYGIGDSVKSQTVYLSK